MATATAAIFLLATGTGKALSTENEVLYPAKQESRGRISLPPNHDNPSAGRVVVWGEGIQGQVTVETESGIDIKLATINGQCLEQVIAISAHNDYLLALKHDGTVAWWGNKERQRGKWGAYLGNDGKVRNGGNILSNITALADEGQHGLALKRDGTIIVLGRQEETVLEASYPLASERKARENEVPMIDPATGFKVEREIQMEPVQLVPVYQAKVGVNPQGALVFWPGQKSEMMVSNIAAIASGNRHNLALTLDGNVLGWSCSANDGITVVPQVLSNITGIAVCQRRNEITLNPPV